MLGKGRGRWGSFPETYNDPLPSYALLRVTIFFIITVSQSIDSTVF